MGMFFWVVAPFLCACVLFCHFRGRQPSDVHVTLQHEENIFTIKI